MRKIKRLLSISEITSQTYRGHANFYLDENTPIVYGQCLSCNADIHRGGVSCPDGREGCCVAHYGYGCSECKKVFDMDFEYEPSEGPELPLRITEKIGIAVINPRGISRMTIKKDD